MLPAALMWRRGKHTLKCNGYRPDGPGAQRPSTHPIPGAAMGGVLYQLFAEHDADHWERLLVAAGVGCVRAERYLPSEFWLEDVQARALDSTTEAIHPTLGAYRRHAAMVRFDGRQPRLAGPPLAGQHNEVVLGARGVEAEKIARLEADGVLWVESPTGK